MTWLGPDDIAGTADDFNYLMQLTDADGKYLYDNLPFVATDPTATLPTTGFDLFRLARLGALLLAVGFMLLALSKRRREKAE